MSAPYYTPQRQYFPSPQHPSTSTSSSTAAAAAQQPSFTPAMRDRQARGKDPYPQSHSPADSDLDLDFEGLDSPSPRVGRLGHLGPSSGATRGDAADSYEERRRKKWAVDVLADPEMLATYACSRGDSIPGTRLYFTRILCGFDNEPAHHADRRKASRDPRRRSAGGERMGRH
ncbi:hypothetical protein CCHL11_01441 [Colletotrichum chlorophyti]|uniref:Uncharacterized protein n=1 Tax=Colletotrichum chlorophyti TaxID=708187 RepID=A0A1Q8RY62_9PEZI|nr:hypothetical protein CCHL11_01441 [Colletotrichum chlorophyti]